MVGALAPAGAADGEAPGGATVEQQRRRAQRRHVASRITVYVVAIIAALLAAFPFIVEGIITFKRDQDLYAPGNNPFIYNLDPTTEHLDYLFTSTGFLPSWRRMLRNVLWRIVNSHAFRLVPRSNCFDARNALRYVSCTRSSASWARRVRRIAVP